MSLRLSIPDSGTRVYTSSMTVEEMNVVPGSHPDFENEKSSFK